VNATHQLPEEPIRSKGQAILLAAGSPELPAAIRDISASGIGVFTAVLMNPGTPVEVHIHGHEAHGVVQSCRPEPDGFCIVIALAA
jgi:hypothetical protein